MQQLFKKDPHQLERELVAIYDDTDIEALKEELDTMAASPRAYYTLIGKFRTQVQNLVQRFGSLEIRFIRSELNEIIKSILPV